MVFFCFRFRVFVFIFNASTVRCGSVLCGPRKCAQSSQMHAVPHELMNVRGRMGDSGVRFILFLV